MSRTTVLVFLSWLFTCLSGYAQKGNNRPNVLFIFADDLRPELGCYGNTVVRTPNLDALARQSLVFRNHFVQVPTCGASRFSLLTGMLPTSAAHLRNDAIERFISAQPQGERPETFIHHLRRNGYYTVGIGKISHSADGLLYPYTGDPANAKRELSHSWDELLFDSGKWGTGWNAFFGYADGSNRQSRDSQVRPYEKAEVDDEGYADGLTAALAVEKLKQLAQRDQPFFAGVGFFKPHLPFNAPEKYWQIYDKSLIPLTPSPHIPENVNTASLHNSGEFNSYRSGEEHPSLATPVSEDYARKIIHAYYASVTYVDAQIGKVLQGLQDAGLAENTIVVVWGDHGWNLGDHRVWGKHTLSEKALRSPLIIKVPEMKSGRMITDIVSSIDIYSSLMDLCKIPKAYQTDGRSFAGLVANQKLIRRPSWSYYNNGISMRTNRFRITHYFRESMPVTELYDHRKDPEENFNIAAEYPGRVKRLMRQWKKGNTGLYKSTLR
jgi:arylsulfatase A-like enzyme